MPTKPTFLTQVPGGWAAQRWGGRRTLMASFALWATACLLTPGTAANVAATAAARVAVGVAQGLLIPSIHTVLSQARAQEQCAKQQVAFMRVLTCSGDWRVPAEGHVAITC